MGQELSFQEYNNFNNNTLDCNACKKIIEQLPLVMEEYGIKNLEDIIGKAK